MLSGSVVQDHDTGFQKYVKAVYALTPPEESGIY